MQTGDSPSAAEIQSAIDKILKSPDFTVPDRVADFLRYVVEETLAGREEGIKAFTVAVDVFGRDDSFDPQSDPVVRIEAARLRRALERYYLLSGRSEPILIEIPKGSYVPAFSYQRTTETPVSIEKTNGTNTRYRVISLLVLLVFLAGTFAVWLGYYSTDEETGVTSLPLGPKVLVLPFSDIGNNDASKLYAAAITDELVGALSHFKEIAVFGVQTSRSVANEDVDSLRKSLRADYLIEGSARTDTKSVRVSVRLIGTATQAVIWSRTYEYELTAEALFEIPTETAGAVAGAIAQPHGIVFSEEAGLWRDRPPDDLQAYYCSLRYYNYRDRPEPETHSELRECLESTVSQFPLYATAWALLAHIYIDEVRLGFTQRPGAEKRAVEAARRAVSTDPENVRALQALATTLFFTGNPNEAYGFAEQAVALNPNDSDMLGQIGQLFGLSGQMERGRDLIERASILNPGKDSFYQGILAIICYMQEDYSCAANAIERSDATQVPTYYGIAAITYAQMGRIDDAEAALANFKRIAPAFIPNVWQELSIRNIRRKDQLHIVDGLRKAGADIPPSPDTHQGAEQ
ncbi:adenylate cyclase [Stappia sp. BW2]|uniref:tetratricopeptide repeat protein n=1 Tax=Stappia sp. BW2 TaxID=2592622 RepID=UPI0011DEE434|nr:tetratricopeptide repeat protein [Stappia sp. BW2]TYC75361.1 adenylate cyclase [Stappia sp. BW2]